MVSETSHLVDLGVPFISDCLLKAYDSLLDLMILKDFPLREDHFPML